MIELQTQRDVVVSTRVRLARNYPDIPFPPRSNDVWAAEVVQRTASALAETRFARDFELHRLHDVSGVQQKAWVEQHLVSLDLINKAESAAVLINWEKTLSLMMNEEDHLRIQALLPGYRLDDTAKLAMDIESAMEEAVEFAFDERWGYLTTCPTNTGTGMRASVMMHLPALMATGHVPHLIHTLSKVGLTVRGMYGEGSDAHGALLQVSNQVTLGSSEADILATLRTASQQVIDAERIARATLYKEKPLDIADRILRSLGTLKYARKLNSAEFIKLSSELRLGISLGLVEGYDFEALDTLMLNMQSAALSLAIGEPVNAEERDVERARRVREALMDARDATPSQEEG